MGTLPSFAKTWLEQRRAGAAAVEQVENAELRNLTEAEALRQAEAVLSAAPIDVMAADRRLTSGFVEQQRLFARGRR